MKNIFTIGTLYRIEQTEETNSILNEIIKDFSALPSFYSLCNRVGNRVLRHSTPQFLLYFFLSLLSFWSHCVLSGGTQALSLDTRNKCKH